MRQSCLPTSKAPASSVVRATSKPSLLRDFCCCPKAALRVLLERALRQQGRGGSKRLHRRIDLKRSTSSMGIVERIKYDPNRSSRIALVRWIEGVLLRCQRRCNAIEEFALPIQILEHTTATINSLFSFSSLPRKVDQRKVACFSPGLMAAYVVVGLPTRVPLLLKASTKATSSCFLAQEGGI
ncbi:hypothetical protein AMTR_s00235p00022890 [Amborella trichopoda]|uniref:Large ribosomal subunit protein uL2 RNA-binding domain-containing protein n=1 Tax=Amborella trichopoda TaxID=13333 RepID=W1NR00_AMBTC|nr:hypothetical protein AMTR_s00235p00022890 [Amborella trichopoda]